MAYLSFPSPGKWSLDIFGKPILRRLFNNLLDQHFSKKMTSEGSSEGVCQVKQGSYIDPLVMRFSFNSEFLIGNSHQIFSFFVQPDFMFFQYRKIGSKENSDFWT